MYHCFSLFLSLAFLIANSNSLICFYKAETWMLAFLFVIKVYRKAMGSMSLLWDGLMGEGFKESMDEELWKLS